MWPVRYRLGFAIALLALFAGSGLIFWQARELAAARREQSDASHSLKELRAKLRDFEMKSPQGAGMAESEIPREGGGRGRSTRADVGALAERDAHIEKLSKDLSDARGELEQLRERAATFDETQRTAANSANQRYTSAQTDWQNRLNELTRQLDAAHLETQAARDKTADLTKSLDVMKQQASASSTRSTETAKLIASLQEVSRRRDGYLTSVLRRYRDVTSQFRAMSGMIDSSREPGSSGLNGPALTRIESAISMAEDDLRQLNEANAEAEQIQRKLAKH